MKTHLIIPVLVACGVLAACGSSETPSPATAPDAAPPLSVEEGPVEGASPGPGGAADIEIAFDHVRIEEREPGQSWAVRATLANKGSAPLYGGEFQISLGRKGEDRPFATHGTQVFFSPPVPPGRTTAFVASVPVAGVEERPPVEGAHASVKMLKTMPAPVIADGWKPLDPSTVEVKEVGEKVMVTADGQRVVLPEAQAPAPAPAPVNHEASAASAADGEPSP